MSKEMFNNMANCFTSCDVWHILKYYSMSESKIRIVNLKNIMQNFKKSSISVQEYIIRLKQMFDTLVACGQQITKEKLITYVIDGISPEFEPMIVIIITNMCSSIEKLSLAIIKLSL